MKIGIDFGTTHTSAAVVNGDSIQFIPLDEKNSDPMLLRSMLYITREQESILGREAVETYLHEDTGRIVRLEEKVVGTIENTVARTERAATDPDGPITIVYDVVVAEDISAHGRLLQSIKTGLRDIDYEGTKIFGQFYSLQELISLILRRVREKASQTLGQPIDDVVLGRPVRFTNENYSDDVAETRLREAAELAGFKNIAFEKEPIAAALFYTHQITKPETVFVFDFGGGTLDMTIMQAEPGKTPQILATHGVLVGGDDLDTALMIGKVAPYFGVGEQIDHLGSPVPQQMVNLLRRWQTIPQLSRAEHLSIIRQAKLFGSNPQAFAALETVVTKNYGFQLFEAIEKGKRALSDVKETTIALETDDSFELQIPTTRREFQRIIVQEVAKVQKGLNVVLSDSGIEAAEIDTVVTTGGSSLIPIFQTILTNKFSKAKLVQSDTFGSVTAGLALRASTL
ncbi:MAG: Hsp70 family protein [Anaerolineales bacterium]|nr:Hsp70 family protein [Anaerolineales bacterium]